MLIVVPSNLPSHIRPLATPASMSTASTSPVPASSAATTAVLPITKDEVLVLAGRVKAAMEVGEGEKAQVEERLRKELVSLAFIGMSTR